MKREDAMRMLDRYLVPQGPAAPATRYNIPPELWYQELWVGTIHWNSTGKGACCMDAKYYPTSLMDGVGECVAFLPGHRLGDSWWTERWGEWNA